MEPQQPNLMAPKEKSLTVHIKASGTGPDGVPLLFGAPDAPAVISGQVLFENNYDCKGSDITIEYSSIASVHWTTKSTQTTYSNGKASTRTVTHHHRAEKVYDRKVFTMALTHPKPGKVSPGKYSTAVNISIDPTFPSSS
ncbi:hypothetical protein BGZ94_005195, partial [Podila epigama]